MTATVIVPWQTLAASPTGDAYSGTVSVPQGGPYRARTRWSNDTAQVASQLGVERIGPQHQAGSDSLLTSATFMKLLSTRVDGMAEARTFLGVLHQLGAAQRAIGQRLRLLAQGQGMRGGNVRGHRAPVGLHRIGRGAHSITRGTRK